MAQHPLQRWTQRKQHEHVEANMQKRPVQKRRGQQPPPLAPDSNTEGPHPEISGEGADAHQHLNPEHGNVDANERIGHRGLGNQPGPRHRFRCTNSRRTGHHACGALESHRRRRHALGADWLLATRTPDITCSLRVLTAGASLTHSRSMVTPVMVTGSTGRSWPPVGTAAIASTTSRDA